MYNDNVSDPRFKKWLKAVVGKEGEDLTRHDKWLCMMYPRLVLLHKLLADDGAIFISIDDMEHANLRLIMHEIFGSGAFVTSIIWEKADSPRNSARQFSTDHDFIIVFSKNNQWIPNKLSRTELANSIYSNPDNDPKGDWLPGDPYANKPYSKGQYSIIGPTGRTFSPPAGRYWRISEEKLREFDVEGKIWWGPRGNARPSIKRYVNEVSDLVPRTLWWKEDVGSNRSSKNEIRTIFPDSYSFDTPKPVKLVERVIELCTDSNSIILDSFAGSGTTAHAVLNLNKKDGGNRKFILIEMEDYAETITAERVKRVINGYKDTEATGGSFSFYTLGETVLDDEGNLNPNLALPKIHSYIWFAETRQPYTQHPTAAGYLGQCNNTGIYFYYEPQQITVLDDAYLVHVTVPGEQYIMYADVCLLSDKTLRKHNIIFKKIPRDISKL